MQQVSLDTGIKLGIQNINEWQGEFIPSSWSSNWLREKKCLYTGSSDMWIGMGGRDSQIEKRQTTKAIPK